MESINIKSYTSQFYKRNKIVFIIAISEIFMEVACTLCVSWLIQQLLDLGSSSTDSFDLMRLTFIAIAVVLTSAGCGIIACKSKPWFITRAIASYKEFVFEKISKKNISAFLYEDTAKYISALTNDIHVIEQGLLTNIFIIAENLLTFIGALLLMIWYSPLLTIFAVVLSFIPLVVSIITGEALSKIEMQVSEENEVYTATIRDCFGGFSVIKSFKAEAQMMKLFKSNIYRLRDVQCQKQKQIILVQMFGEISGVIAQLGVFIIGVYISLTKGMLTVGSIMVFVQLMNFVITPIATLPTCIAQRKAAKNLIRRVAETLEDNIREADINRHFRLSKEIEIKDLSFAYDEQNNTLHNINFTFKKGKKYAIVGESGSGKSTLLNLLIGSHANYDGAIYFDKNEVRQINSENLYEIESMIGQNVFIFNASIKDNITMFKEFADEDIRCAIKQAGISRLIEEKGMDYICGENGSGLSGGEKQRISIARSLLKKSQVLLVDEATSALDKETSYQVLGSILELEDVMCIVVTHSLESNLLDKYDQILTLKNGVIIETGTFKSLMERKGYFYSLYTVAQ